MIELKHVTYTYQAVDGELFTSEEACRKYENDLPKDLVFCLQKGYTAEQLNEHATYQLGYTSEWTTEEYEAPAFLRAGGDYTEYHTSTHQIQLVEGVLSEVVNFAFTLPEWTKMGKSKFIRKVKVTKLG